MDAIDIRLPDVCCLCQQKLDDSAVLVPETRLQGYELDGDPCRIVGWCAGCAPEWAKQ